MTLKPNVMRIQATYGFRPSFVLDQNFLTDQAGISRIVRYLELDKGKDTVLEVGPGLGFITAELARNAKKVIAIEKDTKLKPILSDELSQYENIEIIYGDALEAKFPEFNKFFSATPYSISSPLIFKLLDYDFDLGVMILQREFAEKMVEQPGSSDYGRLSVMCQKYFEIDFKEALSRMLFFPQPKVDSGVVVLRKKDVKRDQQFDEFIREIFRYKNKDVKNAVKTAFGKDIEDNRKVFTLDLISLKGLYNRVF